MTAIRQQISAETVVAARAAVAADDPLLATRLRPEPLAGAGFADLFHAASGDVDGLENYLSAIEMICEGYLLHFRGGPGGTCGGAQSFTGGGSRLFAEGTSEFYLLAGDYMYARGLSSIAQLGDLDCIRMLADLISICSLVHCEGRDPREALEAWTAVTLALAGRAAGREPGGEDNDPDHAGFAAAAIAGLKKSFWQGNPATPVVQDRVLALWPADTASRLRRLEGEIYCALEDLDGNSGRGTSGRRI